MKSNYMQQIRNTKNRTIVRPTTFVRICYLSWQEIADTLQTSAFLGDEDHKLKHLVKTFSLNGELVAK